MRSAVAVVACLLCTIGIVRAQPAVDLESFGVIDLPIDHPNLGVTVSGTGPDAFGGAGSYRAGSVRLAGAIPAYTPGQLTGWRLLVQLRVEGELARSTFPPGDQSITKDAIGATALYVSQRLDLYALYAGVAIAGIRSTLHDPAPMPTAFGLGSYRTGSLTWMYGGGVGHVLGRTWVIPAAGVAWRASPAWTLSVLLPLHAEVRRAFTPRLTLALAVALSGDGYQVATDDELEMVRIGELRTGLGARYRLGTRWTAHAEIGVVGPRRLELIDGTAVVMSSTSHGTFYLSTGVSYAFASPRR